MAERPDESSRRKAELRERLRAVRRAIPPERRSRDAECLALSLMRIPELACAGLVLGYGANAEEIDPGPALARLRDAGVRVAYPRVSHSDLDLHEVGDPADLVLAVYGIREPRPDAPRVEPEDIDAVLVPGVAFDRSGRRLGYGGGFYDRFLVRLPVEAVRIGVAFDEQVVEELPSQPHDQSVDLVVTPTEMVSLERSRG